MPGSNQQPDWLGSRLERALGGEPGALDELLTALRPYLHLLIRRKTPTAGPRPPEVSDLVQETLMRIHGGLDPARRDDPARFRGDDVPRFLGWVGRIVDNLVAASHRHDQAARRDRRREREAGVEVSRWVDDGSGPEARAERDDQAVRLAASLERLAPARREVIQARFFEGRSFAEIGAATGKQEGAIRVLCFRAVAELRTILEAER